jgi:anti-sigma B factor antagonist
MSEIAISVEEHVDGSRVVVAGDLDLPAGDALEALVTPMIQSDTNVRIQLKDVTFMDSSGLGALIAISQLATEVGGQIVLYDPSEAVVKALDLTHTTPLFTMAHQCS